MASIRRRDQADQPRIHPLNDIPESVIEALGKGIVALKLRGRRELESSDLERIWAQAVQGNLGSSNLGSSNLGSSNLGSSNLGSSNLGLTDVAANGTNWSLKTIKKKNPFRAKENTTIRLIVLIVGRCSPEYSTGNDKGVKDPQATGTDALRIYNQRIAQLLQKNGDCRALCLIRDYERGEFIIFEERLVETPTALIQWSLNKNNNLVGTNVGTNTQTGKVEFTWQRHGSQLTQHVLVPTDAVRFTIKAPDDKIESDEDILARAGYTPGWIGLNPETPTRTRKKAPAKSPKLL